MATADELLSATSETTEEILAVDLINRVIVIPATLRILGVESDDDVRRLHFSIPRYYDYGEVDLSEFKIQINFENARGEGDFWPVDDIVVNNDDTLTFSWLVDRSAFKYAGNVTFSLCMKKYDTEGIVVKELNTTTSQLPVLKGLETSKEVVENNPSAFDAVLFRLYAVEEAIDLSQRYYTPVVTQPSDGVIQFDFAPSESTMPVLPPAQVTIPNSGRNVVQYTQQELTEEQKTQARENIGAASASLFDIVTETGINRFNPNTAVNGYYVNPNNGNLAINAGYGTTDFIPVKAGEVITYQYGRETVVLGRTIGTMTFLASYTKDKTYLSGERNLTSYTVPDGVEFIRFSGAEMMSHTNIAVMASADKMDYAPYGEIIHYQLKPEVHDNEYIREIAEDVISNADIDTSEIWAAPIIEGVTASRFEIESAGDETIGEVTVPEDSRAESIRIWGKNHFHNDKGATVNTLGVTIEWDAENQEFVFNGTTTASGDIKLINPFDIDWVPGEKYTISVRKVGGTVTLGTGTSGTTYAWGIFQSNASKYIRGVTGNAEFVDLYNFTSTAYELDADRTHVLYFQCWRPGTVFNNYRVKIQIEKGNTVTDWEPYHGKTVAIADASGQTLYRGMNHIMVLPSTEIVSIGQVVDTKDYVDSHAGIRSLDELSDAVVTNAYDKDNTGYEAGKFLWNGGVSDNAAYFASGFIAVEPDTDYAFFGSDSTPTVRSICEYDIDQAFISSMSHQNVATIHTTANTYFLRVCCYNGAQQSLTVRKGTMATGYTPRHSYKIPGEQVGQDVMAIDAYLPKHIYCAVGRTIELYNNQVCLQADKYHMKWYCTVGKALKRKFSITGTEALIGDYTLKLGIYNDRLEEVWAGSTTLHIVSNAVSDTHSVCPIGDSLTNAKAWLPEVVNLSDDKISFVGTYKWNLDDADGNARSGGHEGRSGFTAQAYINGATYSYGGETSPNAFWDGEKFNWSNYKTTTGLNPDAVQIFLGTNGIANDNTVNAGYIKQMIDAIRADDTNIPIFVVNTLYRSNQNGIGVQVGNDGYAATVGVWKYNEDKKVMDLMKKLDALLDSYENLYMVNIALTHDSEHNFGAVETKVNPRSAQTEMMPIESVHPQTQGYFQMADVMFSAICKAYAE